MNGTEAGRRRADMLQGTIERREFDVGGMECRTLVNGTIRMSGLASRTGVWYDIGGGPKRGGFRERVESGSFRRTLNERPDTVLLGNHNGWPLARTKNDSLTLREVDEGLRWDADLDGEDPESRVVSRKVEQGLVDQCSFAFLCTSDRWSDDFSERVITGVSLHRGDVSICTFGASESTNVSVLRSTDGLVEVRALGQITAEREASLRQVLNGTVPAVSVRRPGPSRRGREQLALIARRDSVRRRYIDPQPSSIPDMTTERRERLAAMRREA